MESEATFSEDPITPGMNSDEFINVLEKNIYEEIDKLV